DPSTAVVDRPGHGQRLTRPPPRSNDSGETPGRPSGTEHENVIPGARRAYLDAIVAGVRWARVPTSAFRLGQRPNGIRCQPGSNLRAAPSLPLNRRGMLRAHDDDEC